MTTNELDNKYGFGEHPPYSLYQASNGKWGLIDATGAKLEAIFERIDENRFSQAPWEVVTFDEKEGFSLVAWYDPHEAWFNFTWEDPAYPNEFAGLLWQRQKKEIESYKDIFYNLIPKEFHWLIDYICNVRNLDLMEDDDFYWHIDAMLCSHPELAEASITNPMLDTVMRNEEIDMDIKIALWRGKVQLDSSIKVYKEDYPDGL